MDTFLRIGLSNAVAATALALIAAGVSRFARRPAVTHVLWVIVLLKLITPPLLAIPVHLRGTPADRGTVLEQPVPAKDSTGVSRLMPPVSARPSLLRTAAMAGVLVWVFGAAVLAVISGVRLRRFAHLLRFATTASADVQAQSRQIAFRLGLRRCPPVYFMPGRVCPMLWAPVLGPRLLIPAELWDLLSLRQRASLLLHELAHLKRNDHWVRALELVALTLFWWHPAAWWARHELRQAEEQCCDAWVTWALPGGSQDYASALLEAVDFASTPRHGVLPALASGIGEFRHLKRRLIMIQQGTAKPTMGKTGLLLACAIAALLPLTLSRAQQTDRPTSRPTTQPEVDPALRTSLNRTLPGLHFDAVALGDVLDFVHDVSGIKFDTDWEGLKAAGVERNTPFSLQLQNVRLSEAISAILDGVAKPGVLTWQPSGRIVLIRAAKKPPHNP
jgi:beta-lactamase regulating signal transducer with metallopeptidase domain